MNTTELPLHSSPPSKRRPGNPAMRRGAPSLNPHGRPRVGLSLANAIRARFPPEVIVSIAAHILGGDSPGDVKLATLELLAKRGYGSIARLATRRDGQQSGRGNAGADAAQTERTVPAELDGTTTCDADASGDQTSGHDRGGASGPPDVAAGAEYGDALDSCFGGYQW